MPAHSRAVFLLLDGARSDVWNDMLARGELPNVQRHVIERGGLASATTVFPSVTGVAYATYVTGCYPGRTNLPGVKWLDRKQYAHRPVSVSRFRNYAGLGHFMLDRDLSKDVKTLFEVLRPSSNIMGCVSRGTGVRRNAFLIRRVPYAIGFHLTGDWRPIDERCHALLLRAADRRRERFTFHTTLQVDEHSHSDGPFSPRALEGYRSFDRSLGALVARLRRRGVYDETLLCVASDHGHSEVARHFDLEQFFVRRGLKTLYYPKAFQRWFGCDVAVMVGGNGMANIYLRGAGWESDESVEDRLARHPGLLDDLLAEDAVDLASFRTSDGAVTVRSRRGTARVKLDGTTVEYAVLAGDPFGYPALPARMTHDEAMRATHDTMYPDGLVQIAQLFGARRTGDLVLSAAPGWDLTDTERRGHRSGHGTLHRDHMKVPIALSHPLKRTIGRTVDVFPTILELLGERSASPTDGVSLV